MVCAPCELERICARATVYQACLNIDIAQPPRALQCVFTIKMHRRCSREWPNFPMDIMGKSDLSDTVESAITRGKWGLRFPFFALSIGEISAGLMRDSSAA